MSKLTRREFLGSTALAGAGLVLPGCSGAPSPRRLGPSDTIGLGFVGLRGRGNDLLGSFRKIPGVRVVGLCDVDPAVLDQRVTEARKLGEAPRAQSDARRLFDDPAIDAIVIATPNHTHATLAIFAMQAGKDVYVEKPVTHSFHEGPALVAAARRYRRIVQAGLQNRSDTGLVPAFADLHAGKFGAIRAVHGICYRDRAGIGKQATPIAPPSGLDYDLWLGPAQDLPILRDKFHYDWHWCWNTGNGDIGNQGPHEIDLICWALGDPGLPSEILSIGGRLVWNDAGETPNALVSWFQFPNSVPACFEVRNIVPKDDMPKPKREFRGLAATGIVVRTSQGELRAQRGGAVFVDAAGATLSSYKGDSGATHQANFVAALRAGDSKLLRTEVEPGEHSAAIAHLANASYRLGSAGTLTDAQQLVAKLPLAGEHLERMAANLQSHGVDTSRPLLSLGATVHRADSGDAYVAPDASGLKACLRREPRTGWAI